MKNLIFVVFVLCTTFYYCDRQNYYDVIIKNGTIIDGTGEQKYSGDIGIEWGKIAKIGDLSSATAARIIDGENKFIAPGFIETPTVARIAQTEVGKKIFDTRQIPARRLGKMSEVAATVAFLASYHADYFVGEVFIMGG